MKRILLAPLDWGLGHATRCIPIIRELQRHNCEIFLAGSGDSLEVLRKEFPELAWFSLPGYAPRYTANSAMVFQMAKQLPHFLSVISAERIAAEEIIRREKIDILISDNRYGCRSERIPSVLITHQSNILMPKRFGMLAPILRKLNERFMNRFRVCWIPDFPNGESLAGELSSFGKINVNSDIEYIGGLSRFELSGEVRKPRRDVLAIFSGPEPQRSLLEKKVVSQLKTSELRFMAVRGRPQQAAAPADSRIVNYLAARELQAQIESSALIIARSGYSTVMDMLALGKKAVFIPTPGQTEQEYLAARLMEQGIAFSMPQDKFDLATALRESKSYRGFIPRAKNYLLGEAIEKLLR